MPYNPTHLKGNIKIQLPELADCRFRHVTIRPEFINATLRDQPHAMRLAITQEQRTALDAAVATLNETLGNILSSAIVSVQDSNHLETRNHPD